MSTRPEDFVDFTARDDSAQSRPVMFVRSCVLLLIWGTLVASCAMR